MNNLTPRAQQILAQARKEAEAYNHNYIGTEHILLAMCREGQTIISDLLDPNKVVIDVISQVGKGPDEKVTHSLPYTPRVKKVLALAGKEAKALNNSYIGVYHLLIGLIEEGEGVAARVLKIHGLTYDKALALQLANDPTTPNIPTKFTPININAIPGKTVSEVITRTVEIKEATYGAGVGGSQETKQQLVLRFDDGTEFTFSYPR